MTATQELIQNRLGQDGYAFAKVDPVPTADKATGIVGITFFVDPGNRVYVRNITFAGAKRINDEVLRREMRILEGGWLSNVGLERSKQRLQRLPYITKVDSETTPVPGSSDQVDVEYKIEEGPGASISGGVGYSETYKFEVNGNYTDANFLGSGQRVSVNLSGGEFIRPTPSPKPIRTPRSTISRGLIPSVSVTPPNSPPHPRTSRPRSLPWVKPLAIRSPNTSSSMPV